MTPTAESDAGRPDLLGMLGRAVDAARAERRKAPARFEVADFEPSTGHLHGCDRDGCACIHHLYAVAQDAESRVIPPESSQA